MLTGIVSMSELIRREDYLINSKEIIGALSMPKEDLQALSSKELQRQLIGVTIGGAKKGVNLKRKAALFIIYIQRAFPKVEVLDVIPTNTAAALYSVSGIIRLRWPNGKSQEVFGKIHIEANTGSL